MLSFHDETFQRYYMTFVCSLGLGVPVGHEYLDISRVKLIPPTTFLSSLQMVTIDFNTLPESLHPIEKSHMQGPFVNTPENCINGQEKFICRLE
jgi:hypothetical protein